MSGFKSMVKSVADVAQKNMPHILTSMAVTGTITVPVLAVSATPKALRLLSDEEEYLGRRLTKVEVIKTAWKCYIPAASVGVASVACIIGANSVSTKRNAALAGIYSLTEKAFKEYQEKVVETIGENKELKIRDAIDKDRIDANPITGNNVIITGKGNVLCYDSVTGNYFNSDIERIRQTVNETNHRLLSEMWISLNEFLFDLGLHRTALGDQQGFNIDDGLIDVRYSSQLTDDGRPCLVLSYKVKPR